MINKWITKYEYIANEIFTFRCVVLAELTLLVSISFHNFSPTGFGVATKLLFNASLSELNRDTRVMHFRRKFFHIRPTHI